jgi:hypothetical protein
MRRLFLAGLGLFLWSGAAFGQMDGYIKPDWHVDGFQNVSVVQLIANPQAYDNKPIQIIGFLRLEFEGDAIYLHREDYERGISQDGLWIDRPKDMTKEQINAANTKYVICAGTFHASGHGHMGMFSGEITGVSRLQVWPAGNR